MRKQAILALLLIVPVASFGVAMALWIAPGTLGQAIFSLSKLWLFVLPAVWFLRVEKGEFKLSLPRMGEVLLGTVLGLAMFATIWGIYIAVGQDLIDPVYVRDRAQQVGVSSPQVYLAGAAYFSFINAPIEEYVWRWFVGRQCERLLQLQGAILLSALLFTLHHVIGLARYFALPVVVLGSLGVFGAGAIWSWCYFKSHSLWASTISHILADLAIALVGWQLLYGFFR
ncbi:type II CAAX endopeptidase family protein [Oscillatoria sp. FACHB-1406]|uniref:CPBP family intramembrane glutamic endopeptidase n=1 Tax=Oscillatoria sp. FACHB-1406 TaxID=2692846 RepID=UPI00168710A0|nr:type II CAAX endopeptidase family protein [Oscillatoria sp. FACHB-1406]MBD2576588.1 CPBP family intramembrane metalloprotease [Oscillatoria sp. FACHB-1406]